MKITRLKRYKTKTKRTTTEGKFKLNTKALQDLVERDLGDRKPPRRADGTISLAGDWLHENAPSDHELLQTYLRFEKLQKILRTYLDLYAEVDEVYPRIHTLRPRSGRRSYTKPNIQNVPKRKWGIRGLFVARPGHYFIRCDYTAQELFTLCQAMIDLGIRRGAMWECLTSGLDPHILGATKTLGKPYDEVTKEDRQGQKVVAFGVPGGLGPARLADYAYATFGVKWNPNQAKRARDSFLRAFPDVAEYLQRLKRPQDEVLLAITGTPYHEWRDHLMCGWNVIRALCDHPDPDWRLLGEKCARAVPGQLRTGRLRSGARFTEIANTHFQGLAADVTKRAEWLLFREFRRPPVLVCHDEVIMEFPLQGPGKLGVQHSVKQRMEQCMKQAFIDVCPDVGPYAKAEGEVLRRWGADTTADGEVIE